MSLLIQLKVIEGPMQGKEFTFSAPGQIMFGRSKECKQGELSRDDELISRKHFMLEIQGRCAWVWDLGSSHGTFVNGRACCRPAPSAASTTKVELHDGDHIRVGETVLQVVLPTGAKPHPNPLPEHIAKDPPAPVEKRQQDASLSEPKASNQCRPELCLPELQVPMRSGERRPGGSGKAEVPAEGIVNQESGSLPIPRVDSAAKGGMRLRSRDGPVEVVGFTTQRKLGRNGLGSSFLCQHRASGRLVVIKVVRSSEGPRERLLRVLNLALENLCNLRHEGIVSVNDYGLSDFSGEGWGFCLELEYCAAGNVELAAAEKGGRLPAHEVYDIMRGCLEGLAHAHACGIVHGNITPSNLLLAGEGGHLVAKLGDFTLYPILHRVFFKPDTSEGYQLGRLPFVAPEQARKPGLLSAAADVWSAGAVFYQLLTGEFPRETAKGQDPYEVALKGRIVPIRQLYKTVPHGLEGLLDFVDRALALSLDQRFHSGVEMYNHLKRLPRPAAVVVR